ncbi:MAG: TonB-dependent receptor [Bryobacteraceae bacterium]
MLLCLPTGLVGQSLGHSGTIEGAVTDPTGAAVPKAAVTLTNKVTGYRQQANTDERGIFRLVNIPPNPYHLDVDAVGFASYDQDVAVRNAVPVSLKVELTVAGERSSVTVEAPGSDVLENVPYAHNDIDQKLYSRLPTSSPGSGLSDAIILGTPGVVADSNGFFHPLGDHAQTTFSVDGQPISDQQSKQFSTQIPLNAIDSMELITSAPSAEFGDKTSLVVNASTKSGLGHKLFGSFTPSYGTFGTVGEEATLGVGNSKVGNFLSANVVRSGRFLDTPEFQPIHAAGNNYTVFDHFDFRPSDKNAFHLNLFQARNWFQVPNTYDQLGQDQRQKTLTYNIAPGYQRTVNANILITVNPFFRQDQVSYYRSNDVFADTPVSPAESRRLTNWGVRGDVAWVNGVHSIKVGTQLMQTRLGERFTLGVTDPLFNAVCVNGGGDSEAAPGIQDPGGCAGAGLLPNPNLQLGLVPFDLTRGGALFRFAGSANVNQYAFYAQDTITWKNWSVTPGLRVERYNGLTAANGVEPRIGASYRIRKTGSVLRGAYSRTFETPYNENLVLSSATGAGGLAENIFGAQAAEPIKPGRRNQFNSGVQQAVGSHLLIDADYFWKFTDNAFDFGTLLDTPITFPISWKKSKIDGVSLRLSTTNIHGFQAFMTIGHNRARFFGPSNGGLIFNSPLDSSVFRIDHDQAFQQTTHLRYQFPKQGVWMAFTWRFDSGLVAGAVPDLESALALSGAQQAAIGFYCGGLMATPASPITSCSGSGYGATRLDIPAAGTADGDHNPPRVAARNLFNIGLGHDNLLHGEKVKLAARFSVENLTNSESLYNFLSTFSGTHFVAPRSYRAELGVTF